MRRRTFQRWSRRSPRCRPRTRRAFAVSWMRTASSWRRSSRACKTPFPGWKSLVQAAPAGGAADAQAVEVAAHGAGAAIFNDPRLRLAFTFPVEISRHVAVPLSEPVLDSFLPGIRIRRLSSHRRLLRHHRRDGPRGARLGVEIRLDEPVEEILFAGRRAVGVRTAQGTHRADAVVVNADFARAMERLCPTTCAAAGRTGSSRRRSIPAPRS